MPDRYPLRLGPFVVAAPLVLEAVPEIGLAFSRRAGRIQACLLKLVRLAGRDSDDLEAAFSRANRLCRRLEHPHLAGAFAAGRLEGRLFLAEDCGPGRLLAQLPRRPIPPRTAAAIAGALAGALAYLHRFDDAGLAHRRLGPEQVYLEFDGSVHLLDSPFAGSTRAGDPPFARAMRPSPRYVPPEIQNGEPGSAQSDLYMLGAVTCEMLTGRPYEPPAAEAWRALLPLPADVPARLRELLARLLSPAPRDRPASAGEVEQVLGRLVPLWGGRWLVRRLVAGAVDMRAERKKFERCRQEARALLPRPAPAPAPARTRRRSVRQWLAPLLAWPRRLALPALVGAVGMTALLVLWRPAGPLPESTPAAPLALAPPAPAQPLPPAEPAELPPREPAAAVPRAASAPPERNSSPPRARLRSPAEARARGENLLEGAEVRFQWRDFEGAERMVRQALLEIPSSPRPHYLLGLVLLARGDAVDAAAAFTRAIEIEPGYEDAARKLKIAQERASIR